jgi:hypothetical protein
MFKNQITTNILIVSLLSGCAVYDNRTAGTYRPTASNGFKGMILVEMGGGLHDARPYMDRNCAPYGGLNSSSIRLGTPEGGIAKFNAMSGNFWSYECRGFGQNLAPNPVISSPRNSAPASSNSVTAPKESLEVVGKKCLELGFKKGSDELLNCIEKLR